MIKLYDALAELPPKTRPTIIKYFRLANIEEWEDLDKWHMVRFANLVKGGMAKSSAHTTFAFVKSFLGRFEDDITLPKEWRKLLEIRNEFPMKTYLTLEEVEAFGEVWVDSRAEQTVRDGFYVSCKTGLRHSDLVKLLPSNFQKREQEEGWYLNYVSQKTKIKATIICSDDTKRRVEWLHAHAVPMTLVHYNELVRMLAERAEINEEVTVFEGGKEMTGPKFQFLSSHSGRVSFCTILADCGVDILDIMRLAGHTNPTMTARYIVRHSVDINDKAKSFLL